MLLPLLLTLAGFLSAFVPAVAGVPDLPVFVPFALLLAGVAWAWQRHVKDASKARFVGALACTLLLGGHAYWYFAVAPYPPAEGVPAIGKVVPQITAKRVRDGMPFHTTAQRGEGFLLVFYRGHW